MNKTSILQLAILLGVIGTLAACGGPANPSPSNQGGFGGEAIRVTSNEAGGAAGERAEGQYVQIVNMNDHAMNVYVNGGLEAIIAPNSWASIYVGNGSGSANIVAQSINNPGTKFNANVDPNTSILMIP